MGTGQAPVTLEWNNLPEGQNKANPRETFQAEMFWEFMAITALAIRNGLGCWDGVCVGSGRDVAGRDAHSVVVMPVLLDARF